MALAVRCYGMSLDHGEDFTLLDAIINTLPTRAGSPHSATSRRRVSIVPVQPKAEIAPGTRPVKENNAVTAIPKKMPKREQDNDDDSKLAVDLANLIEEAEKEAQSTTKARRVSIGPVQHPEASSSSQDAAEAARQERVRLGPRPPPFPPPCH